MQPSYEGIIRDILLVKTIQTLRHGAQKEQKARRRAACDCTLALRRRTQQLSGTLQYCQLKSPMGRNRPHFK